MRRMPLRFSFRNELPAWRAALAAGAIGLGLLSGAAAQETASQDAAAGAASLQVNTEARRVEATPVDVVNGAVLLTLEEAVEVALRQNLDIAVERYNRTEARLGVMQNLGIYDLRGEASAFARDQTSPQVSEFEASQDNVQNVSFGVRQLLPSGGDLFVGWENSRREANTNLLNPVYGSNATFQFNKPLLRGFGNLYTDRLLLIARRRSELSREVFETQVSTTVQQVIDAYWNLVEARQQLNVAQESLNLARELHERNRIQVEVGTMAPLDLVQSEANVAVREEGIIQAQGQLGDAEDELRRLLNMPEGELWGTEIRPATDPVVAHQPINVDAAIATALERRPELRSQLIQIQEARINQQITTSESRPTLDLNVSYGLSGVGGTLRDRSGAIISNSGYSDALDQITGLDFDVWTARLDFSVPLQNRQARAANTIARLGVESAETALESLRDSIVTEVRQAARRVETAAKQIEAAKASRVFQERNLEAQRKRYENGMATVFEITQVQEDLTQARSREVTAIIAYRTAVANYQRATGQLLTEEGISLEDQEATVDRWQFSRR